jgi:hypothetical protein
MLLCMQSIHPRRGTNGFEHIGVITRRLVASVIAARLKAAENGFDPANDNESPGIAGGQREFTAAPWSPPNAPS